MPWNLHERDRGKFDFSGNLDLRYVVLMALFRTRLACVLVLDEEVIASL